MNVSVLIATYGDPEWIKTAERAYLSARNQGAADIILHHDDEGTIASSRNASIGAASGDWLLFLDADDELAPGYLDAMKAAYTGDDRALLTPAVQQIRKGRAGAPSFFDRGISLRQDNWLVVGTLIHKDLFLKVEGFGNYPHGFEDFSLWSKCFRVGASVVKVPAAIYLYYFNPQSKHKQGWRDRKWQVETHQRVVRELDEWEARHA